MKLLHKFVERVFMSFPYTKRLYSCFGCDLVPQVTRNMLRACATMFSHYNYNTQLAWNVFFLIFLMQICKCILFIPCLTLIIDEKIFLSPMIKSSIYFSIAFSLLLQSRSNVLIFFFEKLIMLLHFIPTYLSTQSNVDMCHI